LRPLASARAIARIVIPTPRTVYSVLVLLKPDNLRIKVSGWKPAVAIGAAGGVIGGFSTFPGSMAVVYLGCAA
jgi:hypothetical protein